MTIGQAHITHNHALSDAASLLVGRLIQLALLGHSMDRLERQSTAVVAEFPSFRFAPYHGMATAYVVDTVQTVLHFLFTTSSFEECVVATVNQGGDADTTGAIVGAIAGAYYGFEGIPPGMVAQAGPPGARRIGRACRQARRLVAAGARATGHGLPHPREAKEVRLDKSYALTWNLCDLPAWYIGSLAFNEKPQRFELQTVAHSTSDLFRYLDVFSEPSARTEAFNAYVAAKFHLHELDGEHTNNAKRSLRNTYVRYLRGWGVDSNSIEGRGAEGVGSRVASACDRPTTRARFPRTARKASWHSPSIE